MRAASRSDRRTCALQTTGNVAVALALLIAGCAASGLSGFVSQLALFGLRSCKLRIRGDASSAVAPVAADEVPGGISTATHAPASVAA